MYLDDQLDNVCFSTLSSIGLNLRVFSNSSYLIHLSFQAWNPATANRPGGCCDRVTSCMSLVLGLHKAYRRISKKSSVVGDMKMFDFRFSGGRE